MAGGLGKRMESTTPKVLHELQGRPMLVRVIETALTLQPHTILVVVGKYKGQIEGVLAKWNVLEHVEFVMQPNAKGTGHAIQCCRPRLLQEPLDSKALILSGDVPLIKGDTLYEIFNQTTQASIVTAEYEDPTGYGRVLTRGDTFDAIVEDKDCSPEERKCRTINAGIYVFETESLCEYLPRLKNDNAQCEYYLTDIVGMYPSNDVYMYHVPAERQLELIGVNTKEQLEMLNESGAAELS